MNLNLSTIKRSRDQRAVFGCPSSDIYPMVTRTWYQGYQDTQPPTSMLSCRRSLTWNAAVVVRVPACGMVCHVPGTTGHTRNITTINTTVDRVGKSKIDGWVCVWYNVSYTSNNGRQAVFMDDMKTKIILVANTPKPLPWQERTYYLILHLCVRGGYYYYCCCFPAAENTQLGFQVFCRQQRRRGST